MSAPPPGSGLPWVWQASEQEVAAEYRCDRNATRPGSRMVRAVSVAAPASTAWAWLGNLRVAPYSYDLLDNLGRRSPRILRTDLPPLAVGDTVMTIFRAVEVAPGEELVLRTRGRAGSRLFGDVVVGYAVRPAAMGCRLVAVFHLAGGSTRASRLRHAALAWGDLVMMRKQLRTLAALAEGPDA
ncbi:MAG: SRPBCC family protein [Ornithinibacter sp.]